MENKNLSFKYQSGILICAKPPQTISLSFLPTSQALLALEYNTPLGSPRSESNPHLNTQLENH